MNKNAVYGVRFNETLRLQQLLTPDRLGEDADISTISHCQDFEENLPVRAIFTQVQFETETPPMHLPHTLISADDPTWLRAHIKKHPKYSRQPSGYFWDPTR